MNAGWHKHIRAILLLALVHQRQRWCSQTELQSESLQCRCPFQKDFLFRQLLKLRTSRNRLGWGLGRYMFVEGHRMFWVLVQKPHSLQGEGGNVAMLAAESSHETHGLQSQDREAASPLTAPAPSSHPCKHPSALPEQSEFLAHRL